MRKLFNNRIALKQELLFLALAFSIAWSVWIPFLLSGTEGFSPFITLGAWGPSLAAFTILYLRSGKSGVQRLIKKITIWRVLPRWYAVALAMPAAITAGTLATLYLFEPSFTLQKVESALPGGSFLALPFIFLVNILLGGPLAEEFGWRGYLVPRIQARFGAFISGVMVGIIWVLWHAPLFILGSQGSVVGGIPFLWYLPLITGFSVIFVYLYNGTGGSVLLCVLFHASINTFISMISLSDLAHSSFAIAMIFTWISVGIVGFSTKSFSGKASQQRQGKERLYAKRS
ncbi:MAG: CPBP family intramembrane metalloprotease [Candidatus Marinimicrobia bacterium]|nr:CPBP family intramembrane metalloprotease [Candidatus Neomarinimicrobiota bacterium]